MTVSKLNPWNWFRREHEQESSLPIRQTEREPNPIGSPLDQFHAEFDRMVNSMFAGFGLPDPPGRARPASVQTSGFPIKPKVDVYGTETDYVIEAELPGIDEQDLSIDLKDDLLVLTAEKKSESETRDKGYYRIERSSGSFRRVFNVPADADRERISAKLNKGVLCITMPRNKAVQGNVRSIAIEHNPTA